MLDWLVDPLVHALHNQAAAPMVLTAILGYIICSVKTKTVEWFRRTQRIVWAEVRAFGNNDQMFTIEQLCTHVKDRGHIPCWLVSLYLKHWGRQGKLVRTCANKLGPMDHFKLLTLPVFLLHQRNQVIWLAIHTLNRRGHKIWHGSVARETNKHMSMADRHINVALRHGAEMGWLLPYTGKGAYRLVTCYELTSEVTALHT